VICAMLEDSADGVDAESQPKVPRICRKLKIKRPSCKANELFHQTQLDMITTLEACGFSHYFPKESAREGVRSQPKSPFNCSKPARQSVASKFIAHMRELKSKRHNFLVAQPSFISPEPAERSGLNAHAMIACLLRDNRCVQEDDEFVL